VSVYSTISNYAFPQEKEGYRVIWDANELTDPTIPQEQMDGYAASVDPRLRSLGTRTICMTGGMEVEAGDKDVGVSSLVEYDLLRIFNGVPEGPSMQDRLPLSVNYHLLHGISFKKGCYIGQEQTARHFH
jgi:folate-binding protein YgfZ